MPSYLFKAVDAEGKAVNGVRAAATRQEVISRLRSENLVVTSVDDESAPASAQKGKLAALLEKTFQSHVRGSDLLVFARQFSAMLKAGVSLTDALHTIAHTSGSPTFRKMLLLVRTDIQRGQPLTEAMGKHPQAFDVLFLSIVHAGETSGSLAQNVSRLAVYLERKERFRMKLRAATAYPKFVAGFFMILTGVIFLFLIPKFKELFDSYHARLPMITLIVMNFSAFLKHYLVVILPAMVLMVVGLMVLRRTQKGGAIVDRVILKIPFFGALMLHAAVARLAMTLGTLLSNGIPLTDALQIATGTLNNSLLEEGCRNARKDVMQGAGLAESLGRVQELPRLLPRMVRVGEEAGTLSSMLEDVAGYYDQEVDYALARISVIIEPILICGMGVVVLITVIAIYLPIFNLGRVLRGGG